MPSPDRPVARRPHRAPSGDTYLTSDTGKQYEKENHNWMKTIKKEGNTIDQLRGDRTVRQVMIPTSLQIRESSMKKKITIG